MYLIKKNLDQDISNLQQVLKMKPKPVGVSWIDNYLTALNGHIIINSGSNLNLQIKPVMTKKAGTSDIQIIPQTLMLNPYTYIYTWPE